MHELIVLRCVVVRIVDWDKLFMVDMDDMSGLGSLKMILQMIIITATFVPKKVFLEA